MSTEIHTLSGAYALNALSNEEAEHFCAHLDQCPACRTEVVELREAAARLGAAEPMDPPQALRARVLETVDHTPQQPPKVTALDAVRRRRGLPRLATAAAAVALVVGGAIGVGQLGNDSEPVLAAGASEVFSASDARTAEVKTDRGVVKVATSPGRNEMAVDARGLQALDSEHDYQVWSIVGGRPVPVLVLGDQDTGASMEMPAPGTTVAITVEPAGGSEAPTSEPIVEVDPRAV